MSWTADIFIGQFFWYALTVVGEPAVPYLQSPTSLVLPYPFGNRPSWRMPTSGQPSVHWASRFSCLKLTLLTYLLANTRRGVYGQELAACRASHGDDEFTLSVSLLQIPDGLWNLGERVRPVDDWGELAGFDEILEDDHVLVVLLADECAQLLAHERGQHHRPELTINASEPPSSPFAFNDDESSLGGEGA